MAKTLNYLHGFNSAALDSDTKVQDLRRRFNVNLINYDSFASREAIIEQIEAQSVSGADVAFIGTSLGGYFAAVMGQRTARPAIMVNPSGDPHWGLGKYLDRSLANPKLPEAPLRALDRATVASYAGHALSADALDYAVPPMLVLDLEDELLDARATLRDYGHLAPPLVFDGGSHRFEHMAEALDGIEAYAWPD